MKIHRYYLTTTPWWIINGSLPEMCQPMILVRIGKALGMIK